uniref:Uncharacterized protein n=1 Tax=Anopheles atroparvus TaxID=41427 RepID=A0AAG5D916_ANOAO
MLKITKQISAIIQPNLSPSKATKGAKSTCIQLFFQRVCLVQIHFGFFLTTAGISRCRPKFGRQLKMNSVCVSKGNMHLPIVAVHHIKTHCWTCVVPERNDKWFRVH